MKYKYLCVIILLIVFFMGCSPQVRKTYILEKPISYDQGFNTAIKTFYDLGMTTSGMGTNKETGVLSGSMEKNSALELVGGSYHKCIDVYLEKKPTGEVHRIIITGENIGGMIPHSKTGAENTCQLYLDKFKENINVLENTEVQQ